MTDRQQDLLTTSANRYFGHILPAATSLGIRGGAYHAITNKLIQAGLLHTDDHGNLCMAEAGYQAINMTLADAEFIAEGASIGEEEAAFEAETALVAPEEEAAPKERKVRTGTKQAKIIEMLQTPEGATLTQIMEATGWQIHTARAVLSRTIQKDLGHALVSEKTGGQERVYRIMQA